MNNSIFRGECSWAELFTNPRVPRSDTTKNLHFDEFKWKLFKSYILLPA